MTTPNFSTPTVKEREEFFSSPLFPLPKKSYDIVHKAQHYNVHPVFHRECIEYVQYLDFCSGNAFKYLFRFKDKDNPAQDISKALYYLSRATPHVIPGHEKEVEQLYYELHQEFHDWVVGKEKALNGGINFFDMEVYGTLVDILGQCLGKETSIEREILENYSKILQERLDNIL